MTRAPRTGLVLDDQLCFALYTASRAMTGAYREGLSRLGLTYTQYVVLLLLWEQRTLPLGSIGERLHLDSATLSPLLKRLAARGLVTRQRRADDERVVDITCTPAGLALRESVAAVQAGVEAATGLSHDRLATLREELHQVASRLRDATAQADTASVVG